MNTSEIYQLRSSSDLPKVKELIDNLFKNIKNSPDQVKNHQILKIFDNSIFNVNIVENFQSKIVIDHLIKNFKKLDKKLIDDISEDLIRRVQGYIIKIVKNCLDLGHSQIFEIIEKVFDDPSYKYKIYVKYASILNDILNNREKHPKFTNLELERIAKILADIHGYYLYKYCDDPRVKNLHLKFKENYENEILRLQHKDLQEDLQKLMLFIPDIEIRMRESDYDTEFVVNSPLRLGLSSANASDNHTRAKEKGSKALNAGINISLDYKIEPKIPIIVKVRRLDEQMLIIKSIDLKEEFILDKLSSENLQEFFKYKRKQDELQLLKQSLVHVGIINKNTKDPLSDIIKFTNGGGLQLITEVGVFKGSGLGTSSILAAAILTALYRISNQNKFLKYPILYDQSILLEQSLGFNSGWQDARGAMGSKISAVKHFTTIPTDNMPSPTVEFIKVDEKEFEDRIVLFYTGMKRFATENLNTVLDVYLSRDFTRYPAIQQSYLVHDEMVQALKTGNYSEFGRLATHYWNLRKIIDPSATNEKLEYLFNTLTESNLIDGALMTGAGGGGFAVIIAKENNKLDVIELLENIELENSFVANYKLNKEGISLKENKI